jgi:hypothetical protein
MHIPHAMQTRIQQPHKSFHLPSDSKVPDGQSTWENLHPNPK